ncbi:LysR family transcriptional regulator [Corynebacterium sp. 319]|uniref:LysR family transcriptional regulator n=1 Tax=unclassified Corynebacterium TaxID=2624378 RepID=UPI00125CC926|nr:MULTISPECIES: LysR family transcriptional regulator [unclassified Corynebacterium]KAB1553485.1 LysR family transcriptional regulator [Corynebacterium sp. 319]KAB3540771.1 LysR family transcriptional regulator [Corynebacterium sp. 366]
MSLTIECLRSMEAVASFNNMTHAAQALGITRAAVSAHVKKLEAQLGCQLVKPLGRGIMLTADGEILAARARDIMTLHDDTFHELAPPHSNELVIAATEHTAHSIVPDLLHALREAQPHLSFRVRLTRSSKARDMLLDQRADISLFLRHHVPGAQHVADLPLEWVGVEGSPRDAMVAFHRPCAVRDQAMAHYQAHAPGGSAMTIVKECEDLASVMQAVAHGQGITPLIRTIAWSKPFKTVSLQPSAGDTGNAGNAGYIGRVPLYLATSARVSRAMMREILHILRQSLGRVDPEVPS